MHTKKKKLPLIKLVKLQYPELADEQIFAHILCKDILIDGELVSTHRILVPADAVVTFVEQKKYVSRGGIKLAHALDTWKLSVKEKVFIDVGASTGGFTHCLLQHGARFVYSVDVGYCQLDYRMRYHQKVKSMERTNIMQLDRSSFAVPPQAAVCDLSFRSVRGAARHILELVDEGWLIALIKPQFEWQQPVDSFDGVIRERADLKEVLTRLIEELWLEKSFVTRVAASPIKGNKGNMEFLFFIKKNEEVPMEEIQRQTEFLLQ